MKIYELRASVAAVMAVASVLFISGCGSQSDQNTDDQMAQVPTGDANADQNLADDERLDSELPEGDTDNTDPVNLQTDNIEPVSTEQDQDQLDIAEYFFTEVDRQWFCSVTTPVSVFTDQLFVERFGVAWFERFGLVDWRRHDEFDQLEIDTTTGERFSLREIFASNTILEFQRHNAESAESDLYECILTTRDTGIL